MWDLAWWTYLLTFLVASYGTCLFLWWIIKSRFQTSAVFAYTTLWIFGAALTAGVNLYARQLSLANIELFQELIMSFWWPLRTGPTLIVLIIICVHMTVRALKRPNGEFNRRSTDIE